MLVPLQSEVHVHATMESTPPPTAVIPDAPAGSCWQAKANLNAEPVEVTRTLEANESIEETYALLASPVDGSCPLSGQFRFESNSYFERSRWGFTVSVGE